MKDPRDIIIRPILTEKAMRLMRDHNQYTFEVHPSATKPEIRHAVEKLFKVKVKKVQTIRVKGKPRRLGFGLFGRTRQWKKAIVTLEEGQTIPIGGV